MELPSYKAAPLQALGMTAPHSFGAGHDGTMFIRRWVWRHHVHSALGMSHRVRPAAGMTHRIHFGAGHDATLFIPHWGMTHRVHLALGVGRRRFLLGGGQKLIRQSEEP